MTRRAVRAWLAATIAPAGLPVADEPLVIAPTGDFVAFTRFAHRESPLSFGGAGALVQREYTPSLLVMLVNPSSDSDPQAVLDGYVDALGALLRDAPTPAAITDPLTGEQSELVLVTDIQVDPAPANALTATVLVPQLTEYSRRSA